MRVTVLGCNGPYPAPGSNCSGYLVETKQGAAQLDLGCGTLAALTGHLPPEDLTFLAFSHWHGDHCSDLLPLIYRLAAAGLEKPFTVLGPEDASAPVWQAAKACPLLDVRTVAPGDTLTLGDFQVQVFAARHPAPAVMYRVEGDGKTLCYTGDTNTVDGLREFAQGADLLLADGMFPRSMWSVEKPHLSAGLCGELAREAGAKGLIVTHLNPAIDPVTLLQEARERFPGAVLAKVGLTAQL